MSVNAYLVCDVHRKLADLGPMRSNGPLGTDLNRPEELERIEEFMIDHLHCSPAMELYGVMAKDEAEIKKGGLRLVNEHHAYVLMDLDPKYTEIE